MRVEGGMERSMRYGGRMEEGWRRVEDVMEERWRRAEGGTEEG